MTRVQWHEPSGETEIPGKGIVRDRYAPGAFDRVTGQRVPFRSYRGGPQVGWATVIAVVVDDDGLGATWTADIDLSERYVLGSPPAVIANPLASEPRSSGNGST